MLAAVRAALTQSKEHLDVVALRGAADDSRPEQIDKRLEALGLLAAVSDASALEHLTKSVKSETPRVRSAAARGLGVLGGAQALRVLRDAAGRERSPRVKRQIELVIRTTSP